MKKLLIFGLLLLPVRGWAADSTLAVTPGSGATVVVTPDGSGNVVPHSIPCDHTTPTQCAAISAAGAEKVDGSAVTQPISASSLPLPSGAATAANQEVTAAGSSASSAQAVQGVTGGVALPVSVSSLPLPTGGATSANQTTEIGSLATIATNSGSPIPAGTNLIGNVGSLYPAGSTPITASATGTTSATTATLAANASLHTYICGFSIRANATAAATANSTVTGVVTGTMNYTQWTAPAASGIGLTEQIFSPCVISSAVNTGISVISAAPGTGGVVSVSAWGFQL